MDSADARLETVHGIAAVATGLGVVTFALFPLALPILILTIVATIPFALPAVVLALGGGILVAAWLGLRALGRSARRLRPHRRERSGAVAAIAPLLSRDERGS